ncbi:hypothetical protein AMECASPLE_012137 [Ameca splendens]|uniref:Uncharacterized protein n=1 Tax=Ameca splendens TaxID=208324 RepID=A0ABV1A8D1_9TELE
MERNLGWLLLLIILTHPAGGLHSSGVVRRLGHKGMCHQEEAEILRNHTSKSATLQYMSTVLKEAQCGGCVPGVVWVSLQPVEPQDQVQTSAVGKVVQFV